MKRIAEMKSIILAAFAMLSVVLVFASCTREQIPSEGTAAGEFVSFNATFDDAPTKTYLDGVQVKWEPADKVGLWYGTLNTGMTPAEYSVGSIGGDARQATLNGFAKASNDYMAVYPLSAALDCSKKGKLTVAFPMKQELKSGSFASGANVSVAYSNTTDLGFKNVGGLLALKVSSAGGHTIKKIRLMGTTAMAGEVEIKQASIAAGAPCVDKFIEGINFLTLDCGDGIEDPYGISSAEGFSETPGTWGGTKAVTGTKATAYSGDFTYYLVSLPGSHTGFTLTFVDSDGKTAVANSNLAFEIARNSNTLIANISLPDDRFKADKAVFINEISFNDNKIELYNPGDEAVDLTGYYFTKDDTKYWAIPAGTTIAAHGYKVFTCRQTDCALGPCWEISGADGFELKLSNGKKVDKVDNTGDGKLTASDGETIGRKTDGGSEWVVFSTGTIFENGVCDGDNSKGTVKKDEPVLTGIVVINEVNGNDKYVELHNLTDQPVDITGWKLEKDEKVVWMASDASQCTLAAHAYLVIDFVKGSENPKEAASGISAGKSVKVELKNAAGGCVDVFIRGEKSTGWGDISLPERSEWSFSRVPDGNGDWKYAVPTKGTANGEKTGIIEQFPDANGTLVLNELDGNSKFIELYNTSTDYSISLEEVTIYKDGGTEPIWKGAQGVSIAPGGYLLLYSEDKKTPETYDGNLIFHSGLSPKKTLKIEMKEADGTTQMDVFTRGSEPWGTTISSCSDSFGRVPDGSGPWKLTESTPGTANGASKGDIPVS